MSDKNAGKDYVTEHLAKQTQLLETIVEQLARLVEVSAPASPNYKRPYSAYANFDWRSIGAEPVHADDKGYVDQVVWMSQQFTRRSGGGKYGKAIWFSRSIGQTDGETQYARLITFKDYGSPEPLAVQPDPPQQTDNRDPHLHAQARRHEAEGKPTTPRQHIKPLDIQRTAAPVRQKQGILPPDGAVWCKWCGERPAEKGEPCDNCRKMGVKPAANGQGQQVALTTQQAREKFYLIGSQAVSGEKIEPMKFNEFVDVANTDGFNEALAQLRQELEAVA